MNKHIYSYSARIKSTRFYGKLTVHYQLTKEWYPLHRIPESSHREHTYLKKGLIFKGMLQDYRNFLNYV